MAHHRQIAALDKARDAWSLAAMKIAGYLVVLTALTAATAWAAPLTYEQCLALVRSAPDQALKEAQAWNANGGGAPAAHCVSLALVALERYDDAALTLERIAGDPSSGTNDARAQLLAQAGNAWLLANEPKKGAQDLTRALVFAPGDIGILYDRARAHLLAVQYGAAMEDIDKVLMQTPSAGPALLLRARLKSLNGDKAGAQADAQAALADDRNDQETIEAAKALIDAP